MHLCLYTSFLDGFFTRTFKYPACQHSLSSLRDDITIILSTRNIIGSMPKIAYYKYREEKQSYEVLLYCKGVKNYPSDLEEEKFLFRFFVSTNNSECSAYNLIFVNEKDLPPKLKKFMSEDIYNG